MRYLLIICTALLLAGTAYAGQTASDSVRITVRCIKPPQPDTVTVTDGHGKEVEEQYDPAIHGDPGIWVQFIDEIEYEETWMDRMKKLFSEGD